MGNKLYKKKKKKRSNLNFRKSLSEGNFKIIVHCLWRYSPQTHLKFGGAQHGLGSVPWCKAQLEHREKISQKKKKKIKHETEVWRTWLVFRILQVTEKNRKIGVTLSGKRKVVVLSLRTCKGVTNHCWCLCKALLITNREKQQMVCAATSFPPYYHWQKASLKIESQQNIPSHLPRSCSALWFYALIPYSETLQIREINNKSLTLCNSHSGKRGSLCRQTLGLYVFGTKWITYLGGYE